MGDLFNRKAVLQMGTIKIEGLRLSFSINKSRQIEPDFSEISVYNLSENTRALLQSQTANKPDSVPVILSAGYEENVKQIFYGDVKQKGIYSKKVETDWITTLKAADGLNAFRTRRIQETFAENTKYTDVLTRLCKSMGVNVKEAVDKVKSGDITGALKDFVGGVVLSGSAPKELERLLKQNGYDYIIRDGILKLIEREGYTGETAVLLTPETGLIGSPEPGQKGITKFTSLLQPDIVPARRVELRTVNYSGFYVVGKVAHNGDTHGPNWYTECEAVAI